MQEEPMEHVQEVDGCAEAEGRRLLAAAFETAPVGDGFAAGGSVGAELLRQVRRRTSARRRARTRVLVPAGAVASLALAGAVALAVTLTATVASAPSAFAAVTAAAAKTSTESFRVTMNITTTTEAVTGSSVSRYRVTGEADPAHAVGEETVASKDLLTGGALQLRFIGQDIYVNVQAPIVQAPPPAARPAPTGDVSPVGSVSPKGSVSPRPWSEAALWPRLTAKQLVVNPGFDSQQAVDPGSLLALLRSAGTVTKEGPASGPGWTGTRYRFTVATSGRASSAAGTVYVDRQGQVRRLVTTITLPLGGGYHATSTEDVSFSDFGSPVSVTAPPASQVTWEPGHVEWYLIPW
jgi:hypothetical protein